MFIGETYILFELVTTYMHMWSHLCGHALVDIQTFFSQQTVSISLTGTASQWPYLIQEEDHLHCGGSHVTIM